MPAKGLAIALGSASALLLGCASNVEVTRTYSASDAASLRGERLETVAVVRNGERIPVPRGARVSGDRIVMADANGKHVHKLGPNDIIEQDAEGRIVAVRGPGNPPRVTRFVPGTAVSPSDSDEVRGQLAEAEPIVLLSPQDKIEMRGSFAADDNNPGGGHVESTRSSGLIVGGLILLVFGYAPSAYVGGTSTRAADKVLLAPVFGPWVNFAGRTKCEPPPGSERLPIDPCVGETAARVGLVVSGAAQGLGTVLTAFGLRSRLEVVYDGDRGVSRGDGTRSTSAKATFTVVPTSARDGFGAAAVGTF